MDVLLEYGLEAYSFGFSGVQLLLLLLLQLFLLTENKSGLWVNCQNYLVLVYFIPGLIELSKFLFLFGGGGKDFGL